MQANIMEENVQLNEEEYLTKKVNLKSFPLNIFIQIDAPCTQNCIFCSRPEIYRWFDLKEYRENFEEKLAPAIERARRLNLTGSGEILLLPEAKKVLGYFNQFKHTEKMFATNGSALTPKMIDFIAESDNKYVIHISLHASGSDYHKIMTRSENFNIICSNLGYLRKIKKQIENIKINFVFLVTTKNIDDLVNFIKFAREYKADKIIVYYNYIYNLDQKYLSCYFAQDLTNKMFDLAKADAGKIIKVNSSKIILELPPKFKQKSYQKNSLCKEAWSNFMINSNGDVIPCDVSGDSHENINGKSFMDVWNGKYYTNLRKNLINGKNACSKYCIRTNPLSVNDFRSRIIARGKTKKEIKEFLRRT